MPHQLRLPLLLAPLLIPLIGGCSAADYARQADRSVERILPRRAGEVLGDREATARRPVELEPVAEPDSEPNMEAPEVAREERQILNLRETLGLALENSRSYKTQLEGLYLQALSLYGTRHGFSPQLNSLLSLGFGFPEGGPASKDADFSFGVSQILPTGGSVSANLNSDVSDTDAAGVAATYATSLSVSLRQPLLRGAGHEVSHEPLVQAERNLVYAIRDFELFREDFSIDVASRYYGLVERKRSIVNQRRNMEKFIFARKQAQALFDVGRANELNFLRARRQELNSLNALIEAEEGYELELDRFRIFLGLPDTYRLDVADEEPPFIAVNYDTDSAVEVALANRLDVINRREQLEDVTRALRLAKNGLLPDLDLSLSYSSASDTSTSFTAQALDNHDFGASITLDLPVDRVNERNSYRSAQISHDRAKRSYEEFLDNLGVSIRSSIRELERRRQSVEIQTQLIGDEQKNVRIAELQFERGQVDNRDVVEANESLLDAKNRLINEQVNYEIARLQLLRDLGILFIDEQGMWKE